MSNPTILEYARHYGLAVDHRAAFAEETTLLVQRISQDSGNSERGESWKVMIEELFTAFANQTHLLTEDRLQLTLAQSDLLRNAIPSPPLNPSSRFKVAWQEILPDHKRIQNLYLDQPLLHTGQESVQKDVDRVRKGVTIAAIVRGIHDGWKARHRENRIQESSRNDTPLDYINSSKEVLVAGLEEERLLVTKNAVTILGNVLRENHVNLARFTFQDDLNFKSKARAISPLPALIPDDIDDFSNRGEVLNSPSQKSVAFQGMSPRSESFATDGSFSSIQEVLDLPDCSIEKEECSGTPIVGPVTNETTIPNKSIEQSWSEGSTLKRSPSNENPPSAIKSSKKGRYSMHIETGVKTSLSEPVVPTLQMDDSTTTPLCPLRTRQSPDSLLKVEAAEDHAMQSTDVADMTDGARNDASVHHLAQIDSGHIKSEIALTPIAPRWFPPTRLHLTDDVATLLNKTSCELTTLEVNQKQERKMGWNPFPSLSLSDILNERIEIERGFLEKVNTRAESVLKSHQILWKSPGLRVLDANEDDLGNTKMSVWISNNDESTLRPEPDDVALVAKTPGSTRPQDCCAIPPPVSNGTFGSNKVLTRYPVSAQPAPAWLREGNGEQFQEFAFSATSSLSTFLDLRGKKFKEAKPVRIERVLELKDDPIESTPPSSCVHDPKGSRPTEASTLTDADTMTRRETHQLPLHRPLTWHRTIVINNSLLQSNPDLVHFCELHGEGMLNIIYRDLNTQDELSPDVILDPNTCLVITNIQSLKQRGLPGHKGGSKISLTHQRILELRHKHASVVVMIGWPNVADVDISVIAKMSAFCAASSGDSMGHVRPVYIPYTTVDELKNATHAWLWNVILEYSFPTFTMKGRVADAQSLSLIQDETTWELFLCRAGMNVIAAQIVLSMIKSYQANLQLASTPKRNGLEAISSLSYFVSMTLEERLRLFGGIITPRILRVVSSVLEHTNN